MTHLRMSRTAYSAIHHRIIVETQSDGIRPPPRYYSLSSCLVHPNLAQTCRGDIPGTVDTWICISARHPGIRIPENRFRRVF